MKKNISIVLIFLLFLSSGLSFYFYKKVSALKADPNSLVEKESMSVVAQVGRLIMLPTGEVPTVATVSDIEKLKDQPFFAKAKVGDKALLYQNAKKAYLYDPVNNRILEVAPINTRDDLKDTKSTSSVEVSTTSTKKKIK